MHRVGFAVALLSGLVGGVEACAAVSPEARAVRFASQRNIIVWDPTTRIQHFVRNAQFRSTQKNVGFIAPTPNVPQLGEADIRAFDTLANLVISPQSLGFGAPSGPSIGVQVLKVEKVAGYEATVLQATDERALQLWLDNNGYVAGDDVRKWLRFYIQKRWFFTAFKVDTKSGVGETGLVRMTFRTDRPYNPYYVPESNAGADSGGLLIYFIGPGSWDLAPHAQRFQIPKVSQKPLNEATVQSLKRQLGVELFPRNPSVSVFRDTSFPNPKAVDDLYFEASL